MVPPLVLPPKSCFSLFFNETWHQKLCKKHTMNTTMNNFKKRSLPRRIIWNRRSTSKSTSSLFFRLQSSFSSSLLFFSPMKNTELKKNTTDQVFLTWASPKQLPEYFWELRTKASEWINRSTLRSTQDAGRITQGRIDASIWGGWLVFTYLPTLTINIFKMHVGKYTELSLLDGSWGGDEIFDRFYGQRDVYLQCQPFKSWGR